MVQVNTVPSLDNPRPLRIRFVKRGVLQYISHLDLMRTMTRAIVRAKVPVKYTEGYNPKPHLVFSAPLPLGAESCAEFLDIAIVAPVDYDDVLIRLNRGLPEELAVEEVYAPTTKFSDIAFAEYEIRIRTPQASAELAAKCEELLLQKPLIVCKLTKSGKKDTDISSAFASVTAECGEEEILLRVRLCADSGSFLKPAYFIDYLAEKLGILNRSPLEEDYTVLRTHLFTKDLKDFR
jgi:radical SAM-linked protein